MKNVFSLVLLLCMALTAGCSTAAPAATAESQPPASGSPYPAIVEPTFDPYPGGAPAVDTPVPVPTPTTDSTLGAVRGRLLEANKPAAGVSFFLAEIKKDAKGAELVAAFSANDSPRVETNANGEFVFVNVPGGRYALILYTGMNAFLLNVPDKEDPILFTVENGETTDLGDLAYDDLPLD